MTFDISYDIFLAQVRSLNVPEKVDRLKGHGEVVEAQMDKIETLQKICEGVHTIIHLAGQPSENARWDSLRKENIEGYRFDFQFSMKNLF
jgi:NAD dependent epimerase/dehydratase family enzyme